jgi:hypothetical protein
LHGFNVIICRDFNRCLCNWRHCCFRLSSFIVGGYFDLSPRNGWRSRFGCPISVVVIRGNFDRCSGNGGWPHGLRLGWRLRDWTDLWLRDDGGFRGRSRCAVQWGRTRSTLGLGRLLFLWRRRGSASVLVADVLGQVAPG